MKKIIAALLIAALLSCFFSCGKRNDYTTRTFTAMDTIITVKIENSEKADSLLDGVESIVSEYENACSKTVEGSDVYRFNKGERGISLDPITQNVITRAIKMWKDSEGKYDITVGASVSLWNVTAGKPSVPDQASISAALETIGSENLILDGNVLDCPIKGVQIDLGGIAKGAALQASIDYLKENEVSYAILDFGGSIGVVGKKPDDSAFKISIKDPRNTSGTVGVLSIKNGNISVSGDYERYFIAEDGTRYCHIIDPGTGSPVQGDIQSVAVWCDDAAVGDALSTALFVMGYDAALRFYKSGLYEFGAVFVTEKGVFVTDNLTDSFNKS